MSPLIKGHSGMSLCSPADHPLRQEWGHSLGIITICREEPVTMGSTECWDLWANYVYIQAGVIFYDRRHQEALSKRCLLLSS